MLILTFAFCSCVQCLYKLIVIQATPTGQRVVHLMFGVNRLLGVTAVACHVFLVVMATCVMQVPI